MTTISDGTSAAMAEAAENRARLMACAGPHNFVRAVPGQDTLLVCRLCQGTARPLEVAWYRHGFAHGIEETAEQSAERLDAGGPP